MTHASCALAQAGIGGRRWQGPRSVAKLAAKHGAAKSSLDCWGSEFPAAARERLDAVSVVDLRAIAARSHAGASAGSGRTLTVYVSVPVEVTESAPATDRDAAVL